MKERLQSDTYISIWYNTECIQNAERTDTNRRT